ncbi:hypothetical protein SAY87_018148 [Trapa incisa]|uniref:Uncharacterized protein n=1 Tax=Trapa incisa TaxID=236973 RepID=A0AAN7QUZ1_9MYRT|nr:hypothetical protein SAY87_018148 [Trapa incisa]
MERDAVKNKWRERGDNDDGTWVPPHSLTLYTLINPNYHSLSSLPSCFYTRESSHFVVCTPMEPHLLSLFLFFCLVSAALSAPLRSGRPRLADQFLRPHNAARTVLREPPLTWDPRLARCLLPSPIKDVVEAVLTDSGFRFPIGKEDYID